MKFATGTRKIPVPLSSTMIAMCSGAVAGSTLMISLMSPPSRRTKSVSGKIADGRFLPIDSGDVHRSDVRNRWVTAALRGRFSRQRDDGGEAEAEQSQELHRRVRD